MLAEKEGTMLSLQEKIEHNNEKVKELTDGDDSDPLKSSKKKVDQWRETKRLIDQLFERREWLLQTKQAILRKVETIKTSDMDRPYTS